MKLKSVKFIDLFNRERCAKGNLYPVTAQWLFEHPNVQGYLYNKQAAVDGLDPWTQIVGIYRLCAEPREIVLEFGIYSEARVLPSMVVYVSVRDLDDCIGL